MTELSTDNKLYWKVLWH